MPRSSSGSRSPAQTDPNPGRFVRTPRQTRRSGVMPTPRRQRRTHANEAAWNRKTGSDEAIRLIRFMGNSFPLPVGSAIQ